MGSRLRENPRKIFEVFAEVGRPNVPDGEPFVLQKYPENYDDEDVLRTIPEFTFPCELDCVNVDHFTFVLTDIESKYKFGFCRYTTGANTCLCIVSYLPWYEIFYKLLNVLAEITNKTNHNDVSPLLKSIYNLYVPPPNQKTEVISSCCTQHFTFTVPDPSKLPSIPHNQRKSPRTLDCIPLRGTLFFQRNLTEYFTAIDANNMMVIFASMLYERRILITSQRMSRLTACVHGSASLIYPMHWQHLYIPVLPSHLIDYVTAPMPFIIGIHSTLMMRAQKMEIGDAVILDADNNIVTTEYDDLATLPSDIVSTLKKSLKSQQTDKIRSQSLPEDSIARAFLRALVALIGGYRDALRFREGEEITFDRDAFLQSRPSSMQPSLEKILDLQIFEQFITDRLSMLNSGQGFNADVFEVEANQWQDKSGSMQGIYKDWATNMKKHGKKLKQDGKDKWVEFTSKANPAVKSAVKTVKSKGKKAVKGIRSRIDDFRKDSAARPKPPVTSTARPLIIEHPIPPQTVDDDSNFHHDNKRLSGRTFNRPVTVYAPPLKTQRPPRPVPIRPKTTIIGNNRNSATMNTLSKTRQYKLMAMDDITLHDDPKRISVGLMDDPDIQQALKKSYSMQDILDKIGHGDYDDDDDDDDSSSVFESEDSFSFTRTHSEQASPVAPPRRNKLNRRPSLNSAEKLDSVLTDDDKVHLHVIVPPARPHKTIVNQFPALIKFDSDASMLNNAGQSKEWTRFEDNSANKLNENTSVALNTGYSAASSTSELSNCSLDSLPSDGSAKQLDHYENVVKLKEVYLGIEDDDLDNLVRHRRQSSLIKRTPAFKFAADSRPPPRKPSLENDFGEFDPLVNRQETSSTDSNKSKQQEQEENLLKDWSLDFSSKLTVASVPRTIASISGVSYPSNFSMMPVSSSSQSPPVISNSSNYSLFATQTKPLTSTYPSETVSNNSRFNNGSFAFVQNSGKNSTLIQASPSATSVLKPRVTPFIDVDTKSTVSTEVANIDFDPFACLTSESSSSKKTEAFVATSSVAQRPKWETFE